MAGCLVVYLVGWKVYLLAEKLAVNLVCERAEM